MAASSHQHKSSLEDFAAVAERDSAFAARKQRIERQIGKPMAAGLHGTAPVAFVV